ncbi:MAG TPA: glycosyltransferase family 4 protein [Mycobacteriales bacterium]|nr:glycosyltransferase family 4 protein [Mycobacteriales bacterium]
MRVLVVTNLYPPHALGGYEKSCEDVVERWMAAGHEVHVLCTSTRFGGDNDAAPPQRHVSRSLEWYWADHQVVRPPVRRRVAIERNNQRALVDALADRPDVVSFWAMGGTSLGLITTCIEQDLPMVCVVEDDWLVYAPHIDAWTSAWSKRPRWLGRVATRVLRLPTTVPVLPTQSTVAFASEYLRQRAASDGLIAFSSSAVVPLGTDPIDFPSRRPGDRPWHGKLLATGRIEPRKGFDTAIRALAELPDATLRIIGPGVEEHVAGLRALATDLGVADRVSIEDAIPRSLLAAAYAEADAYLFPSRWDEPFGMVPLEAMTQATPVVATRRGGSAEFLTDGLNCIEVPSDDPVAIVAAVRALAKDGSLRRRLVNGGLTTSAAYRIDRFASELEALHLQAASLV